MWSNLVWQKFALLFVFWTKRNADKCQLTLGPPIPGSPARPATPGPPGFPFERQIVVTTTVTFEHDAWFPWKKPDSQAVRVSLFCHQVPDGVGVKLYIYINLFSSKWFTNAHEANMMMVNFFFFFLPVFQVHQQPPSLHLHQAVPIITEKQKNLIMDVHCNTGSHLAFNWWNQFWKKDKKKNHHWSSITRVSFRSLVSVIAPTCTLLNRLEDSWPHGLFCKLNIRFFPVIFDQHSLGLLWFLLALSLQLVLWDLWDPENMCGKYIWAQSANFKSKQTDWRLNHSLFCQDVLGLQRVQTPHLCPESMQQIPVIAHNLLKPVLTDLFLWNKNTLSQNLNHFEKMC